MKGGLDDPDDEFKEGMAMNRGSHPDTPSKAKNYTCLDKSCKKEKWSQNNVSIVRRHWINKHRERNFSHSYSTKCCDRKFDDQKEFKNHWSLEHEETEKRPKEAQTWLCNDCDKSFGSDIRFKSHWDVVHADTYNYLKTNRFKCKSCPKSFSRKEYFENHSKKGCKKDNKC